MSSTVIEVVPLVYPSNWRIGISGICGRLEAPLGNGREVFEGSIKGSSFILTQNLNGIALGVQPESLLVKLGDTSRSSVCFGICIDCANYDRRRFGRALMG